MKIKMVLLMFTLGVMLSVPNAIYGATPTNETSILSLTSNDDVVMVDSEVKEFTLFSAEHRVTAESDNLETLIANGLVGVVEMTFIASLRHTCPEYKPGDGKQPSYTSKFITSIDNPPSTLFSYRRGRDGLNC